MTDANPAEGDDRILCGRYRLRERIGRGGMGVVWLAHDELLDRPVAVKEVVTGHLPDGGDASVHERLMREARAAARLDHPGVVRVYDIADETDEGTGGAPWIVMEVLTGITLQDAVRDSGPMSPQRVAEIGVALMDAVTAAHRAGILHRDIKPANVQLCEDGRVVLTDFGIASMTGDASLTRTGDIVGSPAYMSPERARGRSLDPASDLFSLGATLYAAVEGAPPFERETPLATLTAVVMETPAPYVRAGALQSVLDGLLAKEPSERLDGETARAMLAAVSLGEALPALPPMAPAPEAIGVMHTQAMPAVAQPDEPVPMRNATPPVVDDALPLADPLPRRRGRGRLVAALLIGALAVGGGITAWQITDRGGARGGVGGAAQADDGPFSPGQGSVPADWTVREGPSNEWTLATPADWVEQNQGSVRRWKRTSPYTYIAVVGSSGPSAAEVLDGWDATFGASHRDYQVISRENTQFRGDDAPVLTVTYTDGGTELKASFLAYRPDDKSSRVYLLWWQTLPDGWDSTRDVRSQVLASFRAGD